MKERKTSRFIAKSATRLGRRLRLLARGREEQAGQEKKETGEFLSSYDRWPGHEANFPNLQRLLWEIGKERKAREEEKREGPGQEGKDGGRRPRG